VRVVSTTAISARLYSKMTIKGGKGLSTVNNRQRGKATERAVAKRIGGKRVGILGAEDVSHPLFSIEVKSRKAFVAGDWMAQAVRNCPEG